MSPFDLALMNRRIYQSEIRKQLGIFTLRSEHFYMTHHTAEVQNLNKYIYYAIEAIVVEEIANEI